MSRPGTEGRPLRVLVVEDSPLTARVLRDLLEADAGIRVVHVAETGIEALEYLKSGEADVVTLDVNMPQLDGIQTLREIVRLHQLPCLMVSSVTTSGARTTLDALGAGAVDIFAKPRSENPAELRELASVLRDKVRAAGAVDMSRFFRGRPELLPQAVPRDPVRDLVVLGASTGGPRALEEVLACFPSDVPASFVIGQHLPVGFSPEFAQRLDRTTQLTVRLAEDGVLLGPGQAFVAPAGQTTLVMKTGEDLWLRVRPPRERATYSPSIDELFTSAAEARGARTIGVVLTGMGRDGAAGMVALHDAGAATLAESEESAVVFAMPAASIEAGVVRTVLSRALIAEEILHRMMV